MKTETKATLKTIWTYIVIFISSALILVIAYFVLFIVMIAKSNYDSKYKGPFELSLS